ncbi:snRNA-activating protein complex subunit 2 isoform X2 [Chaetodon trifascialis]|uniref:snRNA-activating protein complex subunit 2 isoform X2 n=1 Tax=Chaetodon trifascialis TaxID=109706 RepID=UPI003995D30A
MKPPPRTRNKPDRNLKPESVPKRSGKIVCAWQQAEQKKLLNALKRLTRTATGDGDVDYAFVKKNVPTRSISEVHSVVESLKNKVISHASFKLKRKQWEERRVRKPIEVWTQMASAVAGTLEEPISTAFSQMLIVSSTEPRTLKNCDPPQVHRPPKDKDGSISRTVPLRPMLHLPVQGEHPGTNTAQPPHVVKTAAPSMGPVLRVSNSKIPPPQQQLSTTFETSPAAILTAPLAFPQTVTPATGQVRPSSSPAAVVNSIGSSVIQTTKQPSEQHPITNSTTCTTPSAAASSSSANSSCSTPPMSTPAAVLHARFGCTSKYATKDSPRMVGVKCVVDFERIYRYLSVIPKSNEECSLTPMESAIVLDLLMSLPEELPLLDCNKLHKHLIQDQPHIQPPTKQHISPRHRLCSKNHCRTY